MPIVGSYNDIESAVLKTFGRYKKELVETLHGNLMITTPVDTGTLKANWKVAPGNTGGNSFIPNTGKARKQPRPPDLSRYVRNWTYFTVYNNSPYIAKVNEGINGNEHNQKFIERAVAMTHQDMKGFIQGAS